ncbi:putative sulfate exporter family transporter [Candidatus Bathyarchaeota archaeon]|nr:putative sulfate exporter family transporter [Candidatus Bathyarchaeota archaeon]MBT4320826.1 putative sulfate exporter family transporter [Candidatus Bathyarchaeota archaeon]MBT4423100.1 putative sulfate exporter family transporter [Candidatus Bathyarchaeota archaeon]MBT7347681.1 putative sulfate exporter family transporter [Candidatus Bathyarchaeota archaeon]
MTGLRTTLPRLNAEEFTENIPGLIFAMFMALCGYAIWTQFKPISALMWSFLIGIAASNILEIPDKVSKGLGYSSSSLLKLSIALLGLVTSASVWLVVGVGVINAIVIVLFAFITSIILGKRLGISNRLAILIGVGTSICGASAIAAVAPAIGAKEEEIGIAISGITLFGLISMFLYPYLFTNTAVFDWFLGNPMVYAIWVGSGVHESAQVLVAASTLSPEYMQPALIIKSIRIFMIAPIVLASTFYLNRLESEKGKLTARVSVPLFAIVFLVNSLVSAGLSSVINPAFHGAWIIAKTALKSSIIPFLLSIAFAGVGSKVRFSDIAKVGLKPFGFAALMSIMTGVVALGMAVFIAPYIA